MAWLACGLALGWGARSFAVPRSQPLIAQFENADVRVWKTILAPHEGLGMHRHEHGRVVVALQGGTLALPQQKGPTRRLRLKTGHAYWLPADPVNELHGDLNESDKSMELMIIEMQR